MRRRVLYFIPSLRIGGAERQLSYLCEGMAARGWDVHVATVFDGPFTPVVQRVATLARSPHGLYDPRLLVWSAQLIRRLRPAVVQTMLPTMDIVGGLAARAARTPWVMTERTDPGRRRPTVKERARWGLAGAADVVVANSAAGDEYWASRLPAARRAVIPNTLPSAEIARAAPAQVERLELRADLPLIVYVGRLIPLKRVDVLLEAFAQLIATHDAQVLLLGDGEARPALEARAAALGLAERVRMPGHVGDVWSWLKRAAVFVSLSRVEGMPNTVAEAMSSRAPIVASDIVAHRQLLDERAAHLVDGDDPAAVAAALEDTLNDPAAAAHRAHEAAARVASFTIEGHAAAYEAAYERVARKRCAS